MVNVCVCLKFSESLNWKLFIYAELVSQTSRESQITLPSGHRIDRSLELFQQRRHPRLRFKLKCHFVGNQSEHTQIEWYKFAPSSTHKLLKVFTNDTAGSSSGELGFDVENANDLSAIYMCRLNDSVSTNQQLIQQVYINGKWFKWLTNWSNMI